MKFQNKIIVVTGGGNGMGRELVLGLLMRGAYVAAVDLNQAALDETMRLSLEKRDKLTTHVVDITNQGLVEALPNTIIAQYGAVDGLINNAGIIQPFVQVKDLDSATIERVMQVNFYGTLYMTMAFLPHLLTRPEAHITNIASMGGFVPVPGQTIYGASKAAVKLLTEGLQSELLSTSVRVSVVFPGAIGTNIADNSGVSDPIAIANKQMASKKLAPNRAAGIILDGMERNRDRILVGADAIVMDLMYRFSPQRAASFISKQVKSMMPT